MSVARWRQLTAKRVVLLFSEDVKDPLEPKSMRGITYWIPSIGADAHKPTPGEREALPEWPTYQDAKVQKIPDMPKLYATITLIKCVN